MDRPSRPPHLEESLNRSSSLADLDPYGSLEGLGDSVQLEPANSITGTPSQKTPHPSAAHYAADLQHSAMTSPPTLIDISGPSPPRVTAAPLAPFPSAVRRPSPLQFSSFDDSFDQGEFGSGETTPSEPAPFANLSPPPTVRRLSPAPSVRKHEETENVPPPTLSTSPAQRRWSAITRLQAERQREQTLSPVRDCSPMKEGDSSMVLSPVYLGADELSLIADEGGSFLFQQHEATLDSFALTERPDTADVEQKDELSETSETSGGMSVLLRGLGESTIDRARFPTSSWAPSVPNILPPSLTASTRTVTPSSPGPFAPRPSVNAEPSFFVNDESSRGDASLLNASTASFADYRDSPVKPRVVSIQAERYTPDADDGMTPRPSARAGRVSDTSSSSGSGTEEGPSATSFDLTRWRTAELGTGILHQSPPTAVLHAESTKTLQLGLQSPIQPTRIEPPVTALSDSPTSTLACSTRTVAELGSPFHAFSPQPTSRDLLQTPVEPVVVAEGDLLGLGDIAPSPPRRVAPVAVATNAPTTPAARTKETGAERLKRRLEELRSQKKATGPAALAMVSGDVPSAPSASSSNSSSTSATPRRRMSIKPPGGVALAAAGRIARPRPSALPAPAAAAKATTPPQSALLPEPPKTPGERKDSTAARLERLRTERKQREAARGGGPGISAVAGPAKPAQGLARASTTAPATKPAARAPVTAPRTSLATRRSVADLRGAATGTTVPRPTTGAGLTRSRSLVAPASRPLSTGASSAPTTRPAASPRKPAAGPRASLLPPGGALRRTSTAPKLEFASMAAPRSRLPLERTVPVAPGGGGSGIVRPRASRIGLARPAGR